MLPPTHPATNRFHHQLFRQGDGRGERSQGVLRSHVNGRGKEGAFTEGKRSVLPSVSLALFSLWWTFLPWTFLPLAFRLLLS